MCWMHQEAQVQFHMSIQPAGICEAYLCGGYDDTVFAQSISKFGGDKTASLPTIDARRSAVSSARRFGFRCIEPSRGLSWRQETWSHFWAPTHDRGVPTQRMGAAS